MSDDAEGQAGLVTVRPAAAGDRPALGRLGALLVAQHHDFDPKRFIAPGDNIEAAYGRFLAGLADDADAVVLVAERDGEVVGYVYGGMEGDDWLMLRGPAGVVHDLVVNPGQRRQGVARALLEALLQSLAARGAPRIVLFTADGNAAAQRLFAGAGFRRTMVEMTREVGE